MTEPGQQAMTTALLQTLMQEAAAVPLHDWDPLRTLREEDPQFHAFTGRTDHFLPWLLECQTRKEQRNLPDAVAIQYAIMAMGDTIRCIFPAGQTCPNWDEFVKELKPKFMPHTADWALFVESEQWNMRGD